MRAVDNDPMLEGLIGYDDFNLKSHGWEVYDFLEPIVVDGSLVGGSTVENRRARRAGQ